MAADRSSGVMNDVVGIVTKKFEKTPGLGYVITGTSLLLGVVLESTAHDWSRALMALAVSLLAYWIGGFLDKALFDPIYSIGPRDHSAQVFPTSVPRRLFQRIRRRLLECKSAARMVESRRLAAKKFHPWRQEGIYSTAKKCLEGTEHWEGRVKLCLDLSKALRTLSILAAWLLSWQLLATYCLNVQAIEIPWLERSSVLTTIALLSVVLYMYLRLIHMRLLYSTLAREVPVFQFVVQLYEPAANGETSKAMWSVGDRVIAGNQLPILKNAKFADCWRV